MAYPDPTRNEREARLSEQCTKGFQEPEIRRSFLMQLPYSMTAAVDRACNMELVLQSVPHETSSFRICGIGAKRRTFNSVATQTDFSGFDFQRNPNSTYRPNRYQQRRQQRPKWNNRRQVNEACLGVIVYGSLGIPSHIRNIVYVIPKTQKTTTAEQSVSLKPKLFIASPIPIIPDPLRRVSE